MSNVPSSDVCRKQNHQTSNMPVYKQSMSLIIRRHSLSVALITIRPLLSCFKSATCHEHNACILPVEDRNFTILNLARQKGVYTLPLVRARERVYKCFQPRNLPYPQQSCRFSSYCQTKQTSYHEQLIGKMRSKSEDTNTQVLKCRQTQTDTDRQTDRQTDKPIEEAERQTQHQMHSQ